MIRHIPKSVKAKMQVIYTLGFRDIGLVLLMTGIGFGIGLLISLLIQNQLPMFFATLLFGGAGVFFTFDMPMYNESVFSRLRSMYLHAKYRKIYFYAHAKDQKGSSNNSVQSKINVLDIRNGLIHRKDGSVVTILQVMPFNLNLLSENEQNRKIKEVESVLQRLEMPFQVMALSKPTDLSNYKHSIHQLKENTIDPMKKELLRFYSEQAERIVNNGQAMERQFFIILTAKPEKVDQLSYIEHELLQKGFDLMGDLRSINMPCQVLLDQELRELLMIYFHPVNHLEKAPEVNWKSIVMRGGTRV